MPVRSALHAALALLAAASPGAASSVSPVGVRVLSVADATRPARTLQIVVWYPAAGRGDDAALAPRDYLALSLVERSPRQPSTEEIEVAALDFARQFGSAQAGAVATRWLTAPGAAHRDAPVAAGRFPLVLVAQGNEQSAFDQAPLAERIAARGYVVATTPSPMRLDGPMASADEIGRRAQAQAEDLAFAATAVGAALPVDAGRTAVVGHSFGARGALLWALHDPRVRALISLDGGIGTALGREAMASAPWFAPAGTGAAILHAYEELDAFMAPDFGLLRAVARGELELYPTTGLRHHHFTALGFAAAAEPELARATGAGAELTDGHGALVARVLEFLDAAARTPPP